jgi:hypothetical protein
LLSTISLQAKNETTPIRSATVKNEIKHAKGFELYHYKGSILKVTSPWLMHDDEFYLCFGRKNVIPDSLKQFSHIAVPLKRLWLRQQPTFSALEILGVETS